MSYAYVIAPFLAWLVAGITKFAVNCLRTRRLALDQVGLGGFPSTHTTVVTTMAALIFFKDGAGPAFGVSLTLSVIVIIDALDLRKRIGTHAQAINQVAKTSLREKVGHSPLEVAGGVILGIGLGCLCNQM